MFKPNFFNIHYTNFSVKYSKPSLIISTSENYWFSNGGQSCHTDCYAQFKKTRKLNAPPPRLNLIHLNPPPQFTTLTFGLVLRNV